MGEEREEPIPAPEGIALVAQAEAAAEEIVRQARAEAERILADAKERARVIRERAPEAGASAALAQSEAETDEKRRGILEGAPTKVAELGESAQAHEAEATRRLLALLFGEP